MTTTMTTTTTTATTNSSSHNPFRSPAVSPPPTTAPILEPSSAAYDPGLDEELPPAYTLSPDVQHGESTVQYGPQRPFQPAPAPLNSSLSIPRPPQHQSHQQPPPPIQIQTPPRSPRPGSLLRQLADTITSHIEEATRPQSSWSAYPGNQGLQPQNTGISRSSSGTQNLQRTPPPPLPARSVSTTSASPTSEFARDFYAVGPRDEAGVGQSQSQSQSPSASASASTPAASTAPTTSPTPGRPLLRDAKLLVYPKGFVCHKCDNVGYKHADPSHPCKKCWARYARPFAGPLAYSFSSPTSTSPSAFPDMSQTTFQRPLPAFRSPRRAQPPPPPVPQFHPPPMPPPVPQFSPPPMPPPHHSAPPWHTGPGYGGGGGAYYGGGGGGGGVVGGGAQLRTLDAYTPPPPGALVYPAGDPRLGGRMCWSCDGRGTTSFFLIDMGPCQVCGGVGRLYV